MPNALSYRDSTATLERGEVTVVRRFAEAYQRDIEALFPASFFQTAQKEGRVLESSLCTSTREITQPRISCWNAPTEWTFTMLKDAALLTLELQEKALAEGFTLKDASAFNLCFRHGAPTFVDVLSFEPFTSKPYWAAYHQFVAEFLSPLLLEKYAGLPVARSFLAYPRGVPIGVVAKILPWTSYLRPSTLVHVILRNYLDSRVEKNPDAVESRKARVVSKEVSLYLHRQIVKRLRKVVSSLNSSISNDIWKNYQSTRTYSDSEREIKSRLIEEFASQSESRVVVDYGCNTGEYSEVFLPYAKEVVSLDSSVAAIEALYRRQKQNREALRKIVPLCADIVDAPPATGWCNQERESLLSRVQGDTFLALALVHHLRFTALLPVSMIIAFFAERHQQGVLEYVSLDDPMVNQLRRGREQLPTEDYQRKRFVAELEKRFLVIRSEHVSPTRDLFFLKRK